MASTNKTTNYLLSQYVGTDKPTYLTDYNQDMEKIDAGIHNAQSKADVNGNNIGDLTNLETTVKSSLVGAVNEVNTKAVNNNTNIGVMTNLQTVDKTNLVGAVNEVNTIATGNTTNIGTMANLQTTEKTSLVGAINEVNSKASTNADNISQNASDISDLQDDVSNIYGTILWENQNPTADFGQQTITLSSNDYDILEVYYRTDNVGNVSFITKSLKGYNIQCTFNSDSNTNVWVRRIIRVNDTTFDVHDCHKVNDMSTTDAQCVPLYIVGHKLHLA